MTSPQTVFLLYRISTQYGGAYEDSSRTIENLYAADVCSENLRVRANKYFSLPEIIRYERGNKLVIQKGELKSNRVNGSGGGCFYDAYLSIIPAPAFVGEENE
jgi:hypothetical protein